MQGSKAEHRGGLGDATELGKRSSVCRSSNLCVGGQFIMRYLGGKTSENGAVSIRCIWSCCELLAINLFGKKNENNGFSRRGLELRRYSDSMFKESTPRRDPTKESIDRGTYRAVSPWPAPLHAFCFELLELPTFYFAKPSERNRVN